MFKKLLDNHKLGGLNCLLWKDGQIVYQESSGYKNLETREPMGTDTLFRIASMTKPITAVLALILREEQKLDWYDPITKWFPQFRRMKVLKNPQGETVDATRLITVLDLLTHRAGFTYSDFQQGQLKEDYLQALGGDIDSELSHEQWIDGLAALPLLNQPGELFNYGRSSDLLGILIATIEGKPLGKVMEEKIFRPLGMNDTFFEVPDHKKSRCASNFGYDELGNLVNLETVPLNMAFKERPPGLAYESGGQGLWSTIGDYLKFATLFVQNGSSNGVQRLKPESMEIMCTNQLTANQRAQSTLMGNPIFSEHYGFGLGLAVVMKESKYGSIPCSGSIGSVGWPGAYGGWWTADPVKKTVAIFLTHSMTEPQQLAQGIGFELYEAIDIFSNYCKEHS
ncbi:serine hydrolase domain-containing protein [Haliscomenobacter sp.]|uniref:serine hydrolase domain-containing protein n=1 Tax=Haliscomenobacter sp. TaxID=2717303 RepID=UPI003BAA2EE3